MTETELRTDSSQYNSATKQSQLIHEEYNAARNFQHLIDAYSQGRARDISDEPKHTGEPCIIIGSGATLDDALPLLSQWQGGIICTTSHALSLVRYGAAPTHLLALDPFCTWDEIAGIDWSKQRTKLITTPTVWPTLIHNWPNEYLLYRQNMGRRDTFYASTLCHMYSNRTTLDGNIRVGRFEPIIRTEMTMFASSPPAQMFAAQVMDYGNIFLVGVDFSYTNGKDRFTNWTVAQPEKQIDIGNAGATIPVQWEPHPQPFDVLPDNIKAQAVMSKAGIKMDPGHAYYKKNMMSAWRLSMQDVWVVGDGAITEMPKTTIEHLIAKQGKHIKGISPLEKKKRSEEYMVSVGAYLIETQTGGKVFIESPDPEKDVLYYMQRMNRQYVCTTCQGEMQNNTDDDMTGKPCPMCKATTVVRKNPVDIEANMKRIRERVRAVNKVGIVQKIKEAVHGKKDRQATVLQNT